MLSWSSCPCEKIASALTTQIFERADEIVADLAADAAVSQADRLLLDALDQRRVDVDGPEVAGQNTGPESSWSLASFLEVGLHRYRDVDAGAQGQHLPAPFELANDDLATEGIGAGLSAVVNESKDLGVFVSHFEPLELLPGERCKGIAAIKSLAYALGGLGEQEVPRRVVAKDILVLKETIGRQGLHRIQVMAKHSLDEVVCDTPFGCPRLMRLARSRETERDCE